MASARTSPCRMIHHRGGGCSAEQLGSLRAPALLLLEAKGNAMNVRLRKCAVRLNKSGRTLGLLLLLGATATGVAAFYPVAATPLAVGAGVVVAVATLLRHDHGQDSGQ